jgi:SAM-dependent methyltransferase
MELATYVLEDAIEASHWWFVGRRRLFSDVIKTSGLPFDAEILDVGTGTGSNLRMLRELGFSRVAGVDQSSEAVQFCTQKGFSDVQIGDICDLPFAGDRFDFILATDVIEHVDDDAKALRELRRVLKPAGKMVVTVPAFKALWGLQDDVSHHRRRYRLPELVAKLNQARFAAREAFYFNYLLFVPIFVARTMMRLLAVRIASENQINPKWLNWVLLRLFGVDVKTARRLRPPFGVSMLVIVTPVP